MSQKNFKEDAASANSAEASRAALMELARQQGIRPVTDLNLLRGDFWPESESIDDLIRTVRAWRDEAEARRTD
jgi:hypothetical protein